jgi:hypothetical protein
VVDSAGIESRTEAAKSLATGGEGGGVDGLFAKQKEPVTNSINF